MLYVVAAFSAGGPSFYDDFVSGNLADSRRAAKYVKNLPHGVNSVSIGPKNACAIINGAGTCWGDNFSGRLGNGGAQTGFGSASPAGLSSGVSAIGIGTFHTCAIVHEAAKCWGTNVFGVLGAGGSSNYYTPTQVQGLESGVKAISVGLLHSCAVVEKVGASNASAMCWGEGAYGQLGNGKTITQYVPVSVDIPSSSQVEAVSVAGGHSCAVVDDYAMCWGRNDGGQLGNGDTVHQSTPTQVQGLSGQVDGSVRITVPNLCPCRWWRFLLGQEQCL